MSALLGIPRNEWPEWISSIATVLGLIFAVWAYFKWKRELVETKKFEVAYELMTGLSNLKLDLHTIDSNPGFKRFLELCEKVELEHNTIRAQSIACESLFEDETIGSLLTSLRSASHYIQSARESRPNKNDFNTMVTEADKCIDSLKPFLRP